VIVVMTRMFGHTGDRLSRKMLISCGIDEVLCEQPVSGDCLGAC
jgi:hypothetical protein